MTPLADRVGDLLHGPVAAAMFVLADQRGLSPDRLADPGVVAALASTARSDLRPWSGDAASLRAQALHDV